MDEVNSISFSSYRFEPPRDSYLVPRLLTRTPLRSFDLIHLARGCSTALRMASRCFCYRLSFPGRVLARVRVDPFRRDEEKEGFPKYVFNVKNVEALYFKRQRVARAVG